MALTAGELEILITANTKELDQLKNKLAGIEKNTGNVSASFLKMGAVIGGVTLAVNAIGSALNLVVGKAAQMESLNAEFKVMLGSSAKASELISKIKTLAAATPFETEDLVKNTKTLLQFGIAEKDVIKTLTTLGDVAGTSKERFASLALVFGQISSAGKLQGQDLMQLINVGFNPLKEISDRTGESMEFLRKKMEKGQITIDMVKESFKAATSEGGLFFKNMETQSQTFTGLTSTLGDNISMISTNIGTAMLPVLKDMTKEAIAMTQGITDFTNSAEGMKIIQTIVGALYGTFQTLRVAISSIGENLMGAGGEIFKTITDNFQDMFGGVDKANIAFSIFAGIIQFVIANIHIMTKVIQTIIQAHFDWANVLIKVAGVIGTFFKGIFIQVTTLGSGIIDVFKNMIIAAQKAGGIIPSIFEAIKKGDLKPIKKQIEDTLISIEDVGKSVSDNIIKTGEASKKSVEEQNKASKELGESFLKFGNNIGTGIDGIIKQVISEVKNAGGGVDELKKKLEDAFGKGFNIATTQTNITDNITQGKDNTGSKGGEGKSKSIVTKFELDIAPFTESMSTVGNIIGKTTGDLFSNFQNTWNKVQDMMGKTTENVKNLVGAGFSEGAAKGIDAFQKFAVVFQAVGSGVQSVLGAIQQGFDDFYKDQLDKLQSQHDAEITAIDERLAKEIELIENNGVTKEEAMKNNIANLQTSLATETDLQKRKDIEEKLSAAQKEFDILQVTKKANADKLESDKKLAQEQYKIEVEQFNIKKAMDITNAAISFAMGLVQLWSSVWQLGPIAGAIMGGVMSGVLTGIFASQVALIATKSPPPPPRLARGTKSFGGGLATVGEDGAELINVPFGAEVTPAEDTKKLLNTPIIVNNKVFIGEREVRDIISQTNIDNKAMTRNR